MTAIDPSLRAAVTALASRKAGRLVVLELGEEAYFTDHFVICHATSERQMRALSESVQDAVRESTGRKPSIEGAHGSEWILLDYGDFVVHVFSEAARAFYRLESLWLDAETIDPASLAAGAAG